MDHDRNSSEGRIVPVPPTIQAQIKCVERELGYRTRLYSRWVSAGKMTLTASNDEMALMQAVLETLKRVEAQERLL